MGLNSYFSGSAVEILRNKLRNISGGLDFFKLEPFRNAKQCTVPAIFAYSYGDKFTKAYHSEQILKNYAGPKKVQIFKGDHNSARTQDFYQAILNLLHEYTPIKQPPACSNLHRTSANTNARGLSIGQGPETGARTPQINNCWLMEGMNGNSRLP